MRERLYFMLPDCQSARSMLDEMLLARIEERHLHFLAKRMEPIVLALPQATWQWD